MKLYILIISIVVSLFSFTTSLTAQSNKNKLIDDFFGWSDEMLNQREDSLINALFPSPEIKQGTMTVASSSTTAISDISQQLTVEEFAPASVTISSISIDKTKTVGEIPVITGHSPSGAATLQVPIQIYPGSNGIQPQISLAYNAHAGNGTLGVGWSLSGISKITRINRSMYYDGQTNGVSITNDDAFSLDGMRLIKLSSTASSIRYESEQGKIIAIAYLSNNVISHFQVLYPNGNKGVYGYSTSTSHSLEFPLLSMTDPMGNRINYSYVGIYQKNISRITYGDNGDASIDFVYETSRPDPITYYAGGLPVSENRRLSKIDCKIGSHVLHSYEISYGFNRFSLINTINFSAQGKYFNPLTFKYGTGNQSSSYNKSEVQLLEWYAFEDNPNAITVTKGKFDYGSDDDGIITLPNKYPYWNHYRNSTWFRHSQNRYDNKYDGTEKIFLYTGLAGTLASPMPNLTTEAGFIDIFCADIDGKYEEEVVKVNNKVNGSYDQLIFKVYTANLYSGLNLKNTYTYNFSTVLKDADGGKSIQPKFYYTGDFNGDGKMEVLAVSAHNPLGKSDVTSKCYLFDLNSGSKLYEKYDFPFIVDFLGERQTDPQNAFDNTDRLFVIDYNGDGKSDICHINDSGTHIYSFEINGSTYNLKKIATYTGLKKSTLTGRDLMVGEINGDGLPDLLISPKVSSYSWSIYHSMGNGQFSNKNFSGEHRPSDGSFMLQDVNGDGLADLLKIQPGIIFTYMSNIKDGIPVNLATSIYITRYSKPIPTNINSRNTFNQLLCLKDGIMSKYAFQRDDTRENMLSSFTTSFGVEHKFDYKKLNSNGYNSSGPIYSKGYGATFPYINFNGSLWVLSSHETSFNGSKSESVSYTYQNAVIHQQGLGFRGFERINVRDNIRNKSFSKVIDPYQYMIPKYDESPLVKNTYEYSVSVQSNKLLKLRLTGVTSLDKIKNLTSTSSYTYDTYGNVTNENATLPDGIKITTTSKYANYTADANYLLGFLYDQSKVTTRNGGSSTVRFYFPSYSNKGLPNSKTSMVDGMVVKQENYLYDAFGKITSLTETIYTSELLTSTYQYDAFGRIVKSTDPMGFTNETHYASKGAVDYTCNYKGQKTSFSYDEFGRITSSSNPAGHISTTIFEWDETANSSLYCVTRSDAGQPIQKTWYDALGREVRSAQQRFDGLWSHTDKLYDSYGRLQKTSLPFTGSGGSLWTSYTYDGYDRLLSVTEPSGKSTRHSYSGLTTTTTSEGIATERTYDALGGMLSAKDPGGEIIYTLRPDGQPLSIMAPGDIRTTFTYDAFGRQTGMVDPSAGSITYGYDKAGNINRQVDAQGRITTMVFDKFGRITSKTTPEISTTYLYNADGLLTSETASNGTALNYEYDSYDRIKTVEETGADGVWLGKRYAYFNDGNINAIIFYNAAGTIATEIYGYSNGSRVHLLVNGNTFFKITAQNSLGQATAVTTGPLSRTYSYNNFGIPTGRSAFSSSSQIQNLSYNLEATTGNLLSRKDLRRNITEGFSYDELNRLVNYGSHTADYNIIGNLTGKSDIGTFNYSNSAKPYAISGVMVTNGTVPLRSQQVTYNSFQQPVFIAENGIKTDFTYNSSGQRVKMTMKENDVVKLTRHYLGGRYEKDEGVAGTKEKLYLGGDAYSAPAVYVKQGSGSWQLYYICRDYLGSITHLVNSNGSLVQELSYDAWGRLRNPNNHVAYTPGTEPELFLGRGYTGHEHLSWFGLINMNGRLYDSVLSRFLSPDNYVQATDFTQSFNRYGYVWNNPLKYTDPDGEWILESLVALAFTYLKAAHDNRDKDTKKWAWNPFDWFKNDKPGLVFNASTNTDGSNTNFAVGIYSENSPSPLLAYNPNYGLGIGSYSSYGSKFQYPSQNGSSAEEIANRSIQTANVLAQRGSTPWYSIYNWPGLGSSAQTTDALYAGDYISAAGHFFTCAAEVFTFGYASTMNFGAKTVSSAAKGGATVLEGAVKSNYGRFVSKMPANAKSGATFKQLKDENYLFEATSPGKVPGSSALYQKWVNPQGETFKMIKTTFAPDGSIIHVKPKF